MMGGFCICDYRHMKPSLTKKDLFEDTDSEKWLFIFDVQMLNLTLYMFEGCKSFQHIFYWTKNIVQSYMMVVK